MTGKGTSRNVEGPLCRCTRQVIAHATNHVTVSRGRSYYLVPFIVVGPDPPRPSRRTSDREPRLRDSLGTSISPPPPAPVQPRTRVLFHSCTHSLREFLRPPSSLKFLSHVAHLLPAPGYHQPRKVSGPATTSHTRPDTGLDVLRPNPVVRHTGKRKSVKGRATSRSTKSLRTDFS